MTERGQRYPLSWPAGWNRTPEISRTWARFSRLEDREAHGGNVYQARRRLTIADGLVRLNQELTRLGAASVVISTNVQTRLDGLPRSGAGEPRDPGVAVYFTLRGKPRCLACDRWNRVADNLAAVAGHIYSIRAVERYGVGTMDQAFAGYAQLPPAAVEWWTVLELAPSAGRDAIEEAHRRLARKHHPDVGGSAEFMARINAARDQALRSVVSG